MLPVFNLLVEPMPQEKAHARAALRLSVSQAAPGKPFLAAVQMTTDPHWHIYWRNPGDSGIPTQFTWKAPAGWRVEPLEQPIPKRFAPGGIAGFGYEGKALFLFRVTPPAAAKGAAKLSVAGKWLVCNDACLPGKADLSATVRLGSSARPSPNASQLSAAFTALPRALPSLGVIAVATKTNLTLSFRTPFGTKAPAFFPFDSGVIDHEDAGTATFRNGDTVITFKASPFPETHDRLSGLLVAAKGATWPGGRRAIVIDVPLTKR